MKKLQLFGIYQDGRNHFTKSLVPGQQVYDEERIQEGGIEYREWNPKKSKWGAYLAQGVNDIFLREGQTILYLGVSSGTTASHVSDVIGNGGMLFGVDPAYKVLMRFTLLAETRVNLAPLLTDANRPETYKEFLPKEVDVVFQDVAQRNQTQIFIKNVDAYLKKGGFALFAVKARSIDVAKRPKDVFQEVRRELEEKYTIVDMRSLEPFEKDHVMIVIKKK